MAQSPYFDFGFDYSPGVRAGLMPMDSRRIKLRVVSIPPSRMQVNTEGVATIMPVLELAPAVWLAPPEGEFNPECFAESTSYDDKGPMAIIQAFVDLGYKLGLTPKGTEDRSAEISALRYHLEDMRQIAGVKKP